MDISTVIVAILLILLTSIICYIIFFKPSSFGAKSKNSCRERLVVLFIDATDPDNPAAAAAIAKHILTVNPENIKTDAHLHIVLTGRPVNLRTQTSKGVLLLEHLVRQEWETSDTEHAQRVLEDAASRLHNYLRRCHFDISMVNIYDGGIAPCAPISDCVHAWDFLFDRKDLLTKQEVDKGSILSPDQYQQLMKEFNTLSEEERERQLLDILRSYPLMPLLVLREKIENDSCAEVIVFLGGPATALVQLFKGEAGAKAHGKVVGLYGMFGTLEPGKASLLPNQFNVACDIESACELFVENMFPQSEKCLVTTETAKNEVLMVSSEELHCKGINSYFVELQALWESIHSNRPQPLFDVLPVMAYLRKFRGCFKWNRKKAVLQEWRKKGEKAKHIFSFADSDDHKHIFVSGVEVKKLDRDMFLEFLQKTWS